jgi:rare lipoprotein A
MPSRASLAVALLLVACGGGERLGAAPSTYVTYVATGLASWYGEELAGRRTASGERFDPAGLTLAHRTLPLGTMVEVTALDTGRAIVARVNDRGPGRRDRLVDLSRGAARLLGTERRPLAPVRVRTLAPGEESRPSLRRAGAGLPVDSVIVAPGRYLLQVASFSSEARARALAGRLGGAISPTVTATGTLYRVSIGPLATALAAQRARDAVAAQGYADARLISLD